MGWRWREAAMAVLVVKRAADYVEAGLSLGLLLIGVLTAVVLLSSPALLCLPASCGSRPHAPPCARDWAYLSSLGPLSPPPALLHLPFHSPRRWHPLHPAACN